MDPPLLKIKDPNLIVVIELEDIQKVIRVELTCLSEGSAAAEQTAHLAILDVHMLADMYDGSICDKDSEICHLLGTMSVNLTHLKSLKSFCNDAWRITKF